MLEKFSVVREIGSGGFSIVYEIEELGGRRYAKKLMISEDNEDKIRFKREIKLMSQITHKNIVNIVSSNVENEPFFYIMPLARCNLRQYLKFYSGKSQLWVFKQILEGIKYTHDKGIIHRDLKPENILLFKENGENYFSISDFGLGVSLNRDSTVITTTDSFIGTHNYRSPEQLQNPKNVDQSTDIFALGLIFFEILTGESVPIINYNAAPTEYVHIIKKAIQADKTLRYQSVNELLTDIESIENQSYLRPSELINKKLELILKNDYSPELIREVLYLFIGSSNDQSLYFDTLPYINAIILERMIQRFPSEFETVFSHYDEHISGDLGFTYCDTVARFYLNVFDKTESNTIKSIIVQRLPRLGHYHNRYPVGEMFGSLIANLKDPGLINEIYNMFKENQYLAEFCTPFFCNKQIPVRLQEFCQKK